MKKILISSAFALAAVMSAPTMAGAHMDKEHGEKHMQRLTEKLDLTPEQQEQVKSIYKEQMEKHKEIKEEGKKRMSEVLNDEQEKKLEEMHKERKEEMKKKYGEKHQSHDSN
ncbi:hypothetical protein KEM63_11050 [Halopseudomonas nanhaiensis]|uniref:Spy/CpxP family protein refolding chaperone n=1 Tax=Halopseudomonas nanhaiensis TaxID=2830842 RepID=UPI001CBF29E2|nr:hypothetical protein [Halopseudomonas nanhaiensis]UAW97356.1 hypothetical protein KEM63_11050 [Halopseudomonas nanhaiensis]